MGIQIRRRTKGKNSWLNFSGAGISSSTKTGRVTTNIGPRGIRMTTNLGNGVRYVRTRSWGVLNKGGGMLFRMANSFNIISVFLWMWYFFTTI